MGKEFCDGLEAVLNAAGMFVYSDRVNMVKAISKKVSDFVVGLITWKDVTDTVLDEVKYYSADWWTDYAHEQRVCIGEVKNFIYNFVMEGKAA